jgi:hypothetical protein
VHSRLCVCVCVCVCVQAFVGRQGGLSALTNVLIKGTGACLAPTAEAVGVACQGVPSNKKLFAEAGGIRPLISLLAPQVCVAFNLCGLFLLISLAILTTARVQNRANTCTNLEYSCTLNPKPLQVATEVITTSFIEQAAATMCSGPGGGSSKDWESAMASELKAKYGAVKESRISKLQSEAEAEFR